MAACSVCSQQLSFIEKFTNRSIQRCKACDQRMKQLQSEMGVFVQKQWEQRGIFPQTKQHILEQFSKAHMPLDLGAPVIKRIDYLLGLTDIRYGNVPRIHTSIHLDSDEYAHFAWQVTYFKPLKTIKQVPGRLIGTNKKCYFISDTGADSANLDWNNVSEVAERSLQVPHKVKSDGRVYTTYQTVRTLHISVSKGSGGGGYMVPDILYARVLIDTLVKIWKRQLVIYAENKTHGSVPGHIKTAVFQRDRGRCIQCGYEGLYIEYDHRIPRSKGGPNTVENIQLLCRMCNLKKGDRL
ncbi:MAG TPA: HNH endonuclease signature motif containing protein [Ktedonobacteraceae bacterium]